MAEGKQMVLVHGACGGGFIWNMTKGYLEGRGHAVLAPTLTGLGERSHLANLGVNLTTHILDIVNCIKWADLEGAGITLVGHSYGGVVIVGVAERVPPGTIDSIVFLDALYPGDGQSVHSFFGRDTEGLPEMRQPSADAGSYLPADRRDWLRAKLMPHPMACFSEPLKQTGRVEQIRVKTFIKATGTNLAFPGDTVERIKNDPTWRYEDLPCGHDTMMAMPEETAEAIERAALA